MNPEIASTLSAMLFEFQYRVCDGIVIRADAYAAALSPHLSNGDENENVLNAPCESDYEQAFMLLKESSSFSSNNSLFSFIIPCRLRNSDKKHHSRRHFRSRRSRLRRIPCSASPRFWRSAENSNTVRTSRSMFDKKAPAENART